MTSLPERFRFGKSASEGNPDDAGDSVDRVGPAFASGAPFQHEVLGLPADQTATIAAFGQSSWRLLRTIDGQQGEWTGNYGSPAAALQIINAAVAAIPLT